MSGGNWAERGAGGVDGGETKLWLPSRRLIRSLVAIGFRGLRGPGKARAAFFDWLTIETILKVQPARPPADLITHRPLPTVSERKCAADQSEPQSRIEAGGHW
jgi:hypothetical protein